MFSIVSLCKRESEKDSVTYIFLSLEGEGRVTMHRDHVISDTVKRKY